MVTERVGFVSSNITEGFLREERNGVVYDIFSSETIQSSKKLQDAYILKKMQRISPQLDRAYILYMVIFVTKKRSLTLFISMVLLLIFMLGNGGR